MALRWVLMALPLTLGVNVSSTDPSVDMALGVNVSSTDPSVISKFEEFVSKFDRKYESAEVRLERLGIFAENLVRMEEFRAAEPADGASYSHLTPFADMSLSEFKAMQGLRMVSPTPSPSVVSSVMDTDIPKSWDWRKKGAVTRVKNQGGCGSCWSFAAAANVEGVNFVKNGKLIELSEQELVDCDKKKGRNNGCMGGLPKWVFEDLAASGEGFVAYEDYPYKGREFHCNISKAEEKVFVGGALSISSNETEMQIALMQHGPIAVGVNAVKMQFYFGGVSSAWLCDPEGVDHGVTLVGWGESAWTGTPYWIIKNSWGPSWGSEHGYYFLERNKGACGVNTVAVTATGVTMKSSTATIIV